MLKKYLLITFINCFVLSTYCQDIKLNENISQETINGLHERMNNYFKIPTELSFEFTINDLLTFDDLEESREMKEDYESFLIEKIKKDSNNIYAWNELGNHYRGKEQLELSQKAYLEAYNRFDDFIHPDTSLYYSFKGVLKINLDIDGGIDDIETALNKNKNDSIAITFYPLFLVGNQKFEKTKKILLSQLQEANDLMYVSYVLYSFIIIYEQELSQNKSWANEPYYKIFDFSNIEEIAKRFKNNFYMQLIKDYFHIYGLTYSYYHDHDAQDQSIKPLTRKERRLTRRYIKRFKKLESENISNPNSTSYSLAILHLISGDFEKATEIAKNGLNTIPKEKLTRDFNDNRLIDFLISIYASREDYKSISNFIYSYNKERSLSEYSEEDLYKLAIIQFNENDLDSTRYFCDKMIDNNGLSFKSLQLLIHINFLEKNYDDVNNLVPLALEKIRNHDQFEQLYTLLAMYFIYLEDPEQAFTTIQNMEKELSDNDFSCDYCDYLLDTFFVFE